VLSIDKENERFSLASNSLSQILENVLKNTARTVVKGRSPMSLILEFSGNRKRCRGLIHVSEISKDKVDNLKDFAKLGDDLKSSLSVLTGARGRLA